MRVAISVPSWLNLGHTLRTIMGKGGGGAPPVQNGFFGTKLTNGGGNWGTSADRAMASKFVLADTATLKQGFIYIIPASGSGTAEVKLAVYTDVANAPGARIHVSSGGLVTGGGLTQCNFSDEVLAPGTYWICCVSGAVAGAGWDMGSADPGTGYAVIMNGTFSYASPPANAPAPDANYANTLSTYIEYTY